MTSRIFDEDVRQMLELVLVQKIVVSEPLLEANRPKALVAFKHAFFFRDAVGGDVILDVSGDGLRAGDALLWARPRNIRRVAGSLDPFPSPMSCRTHPAIEIPKTHDATLAQHLI